MDGTATFETGPWKQWIQRASDVENITQLEEWTRRRTRIETHPAYVNGRENFADLSAQLDYMTAESAAIDKFIDSLPPELVEFSLRIHNALQFASGVEAQRNLLMAELMPAALAAADASLQVKYPGWEKTRDNIYNSILNVSFQKEWARRRDIGEKAARVQTIRLAIPTVQCRKTFWKDCARHCQIWDDACSEILARERLWTRFSWGKRDAWWKTRSEYLRDAETLIPKIAKNERISADRLRKIAEAAWPVEVDA